MKIKHIKVKKDQEEGHGDGDDKGCNLNVHQVPQTLTTIAEKYPPVCGIEAIEFLSCCVKHHPVD
eukprot:4211925-Ditylum_brightwellii.AAC.1